MNRSNSFPPRRGHATMSWPWKTSQQQQQHQHQQLCSKRSKSWVRNRTSAVRRRHSLEKLIASLNIQHLETLICREIPHLTGEKGGQQFQGLAQRVQQANRPCTPELQQAADWLSNFLDSTHSRPLPVESLSDVHCCIGLIREAAREYQAATHSYLRALWILSHQPQADEELLAVTLYRLGSSYGRVGKHTEMRQTLQRAFALWEGTSFPPPPQRNKNTKAMVSTSIVQTEPSSTDLFEACSQPLWTVFEDDHEEEESTKTRRGGYLRHSGTALSTHGQHQYAHLLP